MTSLTRALTLITLGAYSGAIGAQQVEVDNSACKDEITAAHLCDESYRLFDLSQRLDRALDVEKAKNHALTKKLETMTATTTLHTKIVYVEKDTTVFEDTIAVLGAVALVGIGMFLGQAIW